ncbi:MULTISPECIES: DUF2993 domain-containing protein [unclassified Coleofasciculus]|uniref:LmeA family phospholipid-binding protein n=1 Tax=unclassified Coleofasciculus TaxID=2692782 RepID=UPI001880339E|nr:MULTISPECIES: DUF2993 domain-containing protein [unclassified Coleofasciculus]MBE9127353.1 DUF2993 domain-containing protein [Coleofasciculus sp. LEGE 07081]MBE9150663.1 DUF2993 domain-containing protein [Coleofasciculus sp. LEGE 07092]
MGVNTPPKALKIISTVVSPAVRLWLRSQVEQVDALDFKITGSDRQILTGHIPRVSVAARRAIYQGLHLSQIQLNGTHIRFNLGQVFKGKPLRLLAPFPVVGQLLLLENDLQTSLQSPLLSNAITELLDAFLQSNTIIHQAHRLKNRPINWHQADINPGQLTLKGVIDDTEGKLIPVVICADIQRVTSQKLQLHPLKIQLYPDQPPLDLEPFSIDLGSEVSIQELTLTPGQLTCRGHLNVMP